MKTPILFIVILVAILSSCNKDKVEVEVEKTCYLNQDVQTLTHDNEIREFILHIPNSYDGTYAVPILFNFHGFGGSASEFLINADMRSLAEFNTFILVYPQGSCLNGSSHWNTSLNGGDNKSDADDFGFVEAMINKISTDYNVDTERVYACGYSNGGMFAYGLANFKSEMVAAIGSVSGAMLDFDAPTSHPMPVIHLHGTSDNVISYNGNNDYNSVQSVLNYWINFNNTVSDPTVNLDTSGDLNVEHYQYNQGNNGVSVEHYKYIGGDHVWFKATYKEQNTAQLIWNFVSQYDINGLR